MKELKGLHFITDKTLVCNKRTNAILSIGNFIEGNEIVRFDKPWEGDHCVYHNFFKDGDIYRMYYLAHSSKTPFSELKVCYMESDDGYFWRKPILNLREYNGNKQNNIILDKTDKPEDGDFFDNFFVFKDSNPKCKKDEKYKALAYKNPYKLECYFSKDGINFKRGYEIKVEGYFDTLNTCFYDCNLKKYIAFVRGFHNIVDPNDLNKATRDIRRIESKNFKDWKETGLLDFDNKEDIPLYTNNISKLEKDLYIGFPTRYVERPEWNDNYEKLCGKQERLERMKENRRYGLAMTDCLFMFSLDTKKWQRFDEAILTPGIENGTNWVYGDCYPAYGYIDDGYYYHFFLRKNQWSDQPAIMYDYKIRKNGFTCYEAKSEERTITLKKMVYIGNKLFINFATSAAGYVVIEIDDGVHKEKTIEMFGDAINREVSFSEDQLKKFIGKPITVKIYLKDAKIYTILS